MNDLSRAHLMAALKEDEGRMPMMYNDPVGVKTIGYGHNLESGPPLSDLAMNQILLDDIADAERRCRRFPWYEGLDDVRQAVIVNMAFNLGLGGLGGFRRMIDALVAARYDEAADEMLDSRWARQVPERARRLAAMMQSGEWA